MDLAPGLTASISLTIAETDTAIVFGSGDVPVLATPRVLALLEEATVAAVRGHLDAGQTTVGTHVELDHLAANTVGTTVLAEAILSTVDGRRLTFEVTLRQDDQESARGRVDRIVVDREKFLERAARGADRSGIGAVDRR